MGIFSVCFIIIFLLIFFSNPSSCFYFPCFEEKPSLYSQIALFNDSSIVGADHSIQITHASAPSSGSIIYTKPVNLLHRAKLASFSTHFSFSLPPGSDGIAFVVFTDKSHFDWEQSRVLTVKLRASSNNAESNCSNGSGGGIVRICDLTDLNVSLSSDEKLHSWIEYSSRVKRLEIRLSRSGALRPSHPSISLVIDFPDLRRSGVYVGISSSTENSSETSRLYSWSFRLNPNANSMHSEPLDPSAFLKDDRRKSLSHRLDYVWGILVALVVGVGFGVGTTVLLTFAWLLIKRRLLATSKDYPVHPVGFEYEKMIAVSIKEADDGKVAGRN